MTSQNRIKQTHVFLTVPVLKLPTRALAWRVSPREDSNTCFSIGMCSLLAMAACKSNTLGNRAQTKRREIDERISLKETPDTRVLLPAHGELHVECDRLSSVSEEYYEHFIERRKRYENKEDSG